MIIAMANLVRRRLRHGPKAGSWTSYFEEMNFISRLRFIGSSGRFTPFGRFGFASPSSSLPGPAAAAAMALAALGLSCER